MLFGVLVFLISCFAWQLTESQLVYKLTKMECQVNQTRVSNVSCHVKAINWNMAVVNMDCFMIMPLQNPVIRAQVFMKDYSNQYKPFLVDVSIKMCEVIEKRNFIPYGVIIWKLFKRFTNVNHSCPFSGQLTARNGYLDTSLLPPFPLGFYQVSLIVVDFNSTNKDYVGTMKFYLQVMDQIKSKKIPRA
ncbi:uncharacterized protein LOC119549560 [Drosophila subpulchrella]|uniref:uncharacterized protein LOC119549560 n=1 Tax=Drosophila subpulchrella TaxID=1486046 RepID=UPI0018A1A66E|nr:uncharacterized protein LOC119549560 [Drosophila subpulchrella]